MLENMLFLNLVAKNKQNRKVLFGGYEKGCDKKHIIWKQVSDLEPHLNLGNDPKPNT